MTTACSNGTPRNAPTCPLCGLPNGCAAVAAGTFDVACWCQNVVFDATVLARVPPAQKGKACICRQCAQRPVPEGDATHGGVGAG